MEEDEKSISESPSDSGRTTMLVRNKEDVKMAGYLEKKGKMKLLSSWKRYWFVLEGRLLLYYRSQAEYLNLSVCKGSLNMGIASCVRPVPGPSYVLEIVTRTHNLTLRTKDRAAQEQWLKALLDSMALPNISNPMKTNGGAMHFRYSMDNLPLVHEMELLEDENKDKQGTLPRRPKPSLSRRESVLMRIRNLSGHAYCGSLETVLKRSTMNKINQPKIPRIKAVDRMLGFQEQIVNQDHSNAEEPEEKKETEINSERGQEDCSETAEGGKVLVKPAHSSDQEIEVVQRANSFEESIESTECKSISQISSASCNDISHKSSCNKVNVDVDTLSEANEVPPADPQYMEIENELYAVSNDKSCKSSKEDSGHSKSLDANSQEGVGKEDDKGEFKVVNNSDYDKASGEHTPEPILLHRTRVSTPESPVGEEYVTYNTYCEIQGEPLSPKLEEKKKKPKLKLLRKKSSVKELDVPKNKGNIKNPKMNFLQKVIKHCRKKSGPPREGEEEPVYDTVDYAPVFQDSKQNSEDSELFEKDHIFGTACLLPTEALKELRQKLKERKEDLTRQVVRVPSSPDGKKISPSDSIAEELNLSNDPEALGNRDDRPQLPPRRARRPSSPWHDIPTNNSPVYGNISFHSSNPSDDPEYGNDKSDLMLGTPQGYSYLQKKWKAVERSGTWHRELRQVAFPNTRNQGPKLLRYSQIEHESHHDYHTETKCNNELETDDKKCDSIHVSRILIQESESVGDSSTGSEIVHSNNTAGVCSVENKDLITYRNIALTDKPRDENFQRDSLMTSISTQTESELDDSTVGVSCTVYRELDDETSCLRHSQQVPPKLPPKTKELAGAMTNRYSDELNRLLAQLAEITSAPLLSPGATTSLVDFPEKRASYCQDCGPSNQLARIRRRHHSEPNYDIPRPHHSILANKKIIHDGGILMEPTKFLDQSLPEEPVESSLVSKDSDQAQLSWTLSMAPDSLEPIPDTSSSIVL